MHAEDCLCFLGLGKLRRVVQTHAEVVKALLAWNFGFDFAGGDVGVEGVILIKMRLLRASHISESTGLIVLLHADLLRLSFGSI